MNCPKCNKEIFNTSQFLFCSYKCNVCDIEIILFITNLEIVSIKYKEYILYYSGDFLQGKEIIFEKLKVNNKSLNDMFVVLSKCVDNIIFY